MHPRTKAMWFLALGLVALVVAVVVPLYVAHLGTVGIAQQVTIDPANGASYASWLYDDSGSDGFLVFNVTNPYEIVEGARPLVTAMGPLYYKTINERLDPVFDAAAGTVSWFQKQHYVFDAETTARLTGGNITTDDFVITAVNVQLEGVLQQAVAAGWAGNETVDLDAAALALAIYAPDNALPSTSILGPPTCCDALPAGDCLTLHARGAGVCGCGNRSTCATAPPPLTDWAGRGDDTGAFVRIAARDLLFGYDNSALMGVVNVVSKAFNMSMQPTSFPGLEGNLTADAARHKQRYQVDTGVGNLAKAHMLREVNGNSTIVACVGSPCVRETFQGFALAWDGPDANAVRGSLSGQFPPGSSSAGSLEGSRQEVLADTLFRKIPIVNRREPGPGGEPLGAGEMVTYDGIPLLKFTIADEFWAPSAAYHQSQQGMLNQTSVEQQAKIRITKIGFADFLPSSAEGSPPPAVPAEMSNPEFFAAAAVPDGSSWLDASYFGVEPTLGTTMSAHQRFQISMEMGPVELDAVGAFVRRTFYPKMGHWYIPIYADDSGGSIPVADAAKLKRESAMMASATLGAQAAGGAVCGLALLVALLLLRSAREEEAKEKELGGALLPGPNVVAATGEERGSRANAHLTSH